MPDRIAAQPALYTADSGNPPTLNGGRCRACGYVFFPPQKYGCEFCGAPTDQLESVTLAGRGALHSFATVHLHQDRSAKASRRHSPSASSFSTTALRFDRY